LARRVRDAAEAARSVVSVIDVFEGIGWLYRRTSTGGARAGSKTWGS